MMVSTRRVLGAVGGLGVLLAAVWLHGAGGATASRSVRGMQPDSKGVVVYERPADVRVPITGQELVLGEQDSTFHSIEPCRIANTAATAQGVIPAGGTRNFLAVANDESIDLRDQGGTVADCGIPATATAVSVNVAVASPQGNGNVRIWPYGSPVPSVSLVNFRTGVNIANAAIVPICRSNGFLCEGYDLSVRSSQAAHVVLDVMGYFEGPKMVKVDTSGILLGKQATIYAQTLAVVSVSEFGPGEYEVVFDRDVFSCTASAVLEAQGWGQVDGGDITVAPRFLNEFAIYVATFDPSGLQTSLPFSLVVHC